MAVDECIDVAVLTHHFVYDYTIPMGGNAHLNAKMNAVNGRDSSFKDFWHKRDSSTPCRNDKSGLFSWFLKLRLYNFRSFGLQDFFGTAFSSLFTYLLSLGWPGMEGSR